MTQARVRSIVVCASLALAVASPRAECISLGLKSDRKYADLVFRGVITDLQHPDKRRSIVTFEVSRVWKGPVRKRMVLYQPEEDYLERYSWQTSTVGTEYLVFARRLDDSQRNAFDLKTRDAFAVPTCKGGTDEIVHPYARDYLRQLGRGRAPR